MRRWGSMLKRTQKVSKGALRCPMCRTEWDASQQQGACGRCPLYRLHRGCRLQLVRCPACGYHGLRRECETCEPPAAPPERGAPTERTLGALPCGQRARLAGYDGVPERELVRLAAYGLVPGVRLVVLQRRPTLVVRFHQTELALEPALARAIYVEAEAPVS